MCSAALVPTVVVSGEVGAMTVTTQTKSRSRGSTQLMSIISWVGAAAIFAAAVTYGLIEQRITVDEPPPWVADSSPESVAENLERHYAWVATTLTQERFATALLLVGLLCAAAVVLRAAARLPE